MTNRELDELTRDASLLAANVNDLVEKARDMQLDLAARDKTIAAFNAAAEALRNDALDSAVPGHSDVQTALLEALWKVADR